VNCGASSGPARDALDDAAVLDLERAAAADLALERLLVGGLRVLAAAVMQAYRAVESAVSV
jgi:hypothetical protein